MRILLLVSVFLGWATGAYAQTTACGIELTRVEETFEQGRLLDILNNKTFMNCFNNFSKEEKIRAYKLLTKAYIFTDNEVEAEQSLLNLLRVDKEHELLKTDPSELHFLYSKFKTDPIFRLALKAGINKSVPLVLNEFNTFPQGEKRYNQKGDNTELGIGFTFEALMEKHIKNGIEVALGVQLRTSKYEVENAFSGLQYIAKNQSRMLRVPILIKYNLWYNKRNEEDNRVKFIPYGFLGGSYDYLLNAKYIDTNRIGGTAFTLSESNSSLSDLNQVAKVNISILAGIGAKYRVADVHFLTFEFRYDNSLFNYINADNRYANPVLITDIGHVEDDLTLNTLTILIGYTRSIYFPVKRKQYRRSP